MSRARSTITTPAPSVALVAALAAALAACSIPRSEFRASPDGGAGGDLIDDHHQAFAVSQTTALLVPENTSKTFTVALAFQPTAAVHVTLTSTDPTALPVSPASLEFSTTNWQTPQTVTVTAPVDTNNVSESATISVVSAPIPTVTVMAMVTDATQINTYGWSPPPAFTGTFGLRPSSLTAYKVHIPTSTLDSFGIYVPSAAGDYRMALYTDNNNQPGMLVGPPTGQFSSITLVNGVNLANVPDLALTDGDYWIVVRVSSSTNVGSSDTSPPATGRRCIADNDVVGLGNNWPVNIGTSTCGDFNLLNLWVTTYHQ